MSESHETESLQERYEALQSICKQLMLMNETLKNELSTLNSMYQKAIIERRMLLDELVDNHSSCSSAFKGDFTNEASSPKRPHISNNDIPYTKKVRALPSSTDEAKSSQLSPQSHRFEPAVVPQPMVECTSNMWSDRDLDDFSTSSSEVHHGQGSTRPDTSRHTPMSLALWNSVDNAASSSTISPSTEYSTASAHLSKAPHLQRPTKPPLVTSSIVTSAVTGAPNIHGLGPRASLTGLQNVKHVPVVSRNMNIIQTSNISRPANPVSVVLNSTSQVLVNNQSVLRGAKTIQSPQTNTTLRFAGPSSGQRIFIQPTSGNNRSFLVQSSEHALSGLSGDLN